MSVKTILDKSINVAHSVCQYNFKTLPGVDTLYYYVPSNPNYPSFYSERIESPIKLAEEQYGGYIPKESLTLNLFDLDFTYLNKAQGFHFFRDKSGLFRIGFKDPATITNVHDIWVQCEFIGIYKLGIVRLTQYINALLGEISTRDYFVNRADLNIFVPFDLMNAINTDNIVTTKRKEGKIFGERKGYETLYIGKLPAKLRIYDKYKESNDSKKEFIMAWILEQHGIAFEPPLYNLEFQLHRAWFKQFSISTLDDLFANVETIFHKCMKMVRLIDPDSISEKDRAAKRMYKAKNDPLWDYLKYSYHFNPIEQNLMPLERIEYHKKELTQEHFLYDFEKLLDKYDRNGVKINRETLLEMLHAQRLMHTKDAFAIVKAKKPIPFKTPNADYVLTQNMIPVITLPFDLSKLENNQLDEYEHLLTKALHQELAMDRVINGERFYSDTNLIVKSLQSIHWEKNNRRRGEGSNGND